MRKTHTVILLPHAAAYNAPGRAAGHAARGKARLGAEDAAAGLFDLTTRLGAPTSLSSLGLKHGDLDRAANARGAYALSESAPRWNCRRSANFSTRPLRA